MVTKLPVTRKNFKKAVELILGKEFAKILQNPVTQLEKSIAVAFIEQLEKKEKTKQHVKLLRTVALRIRKHGQLTWDDEKS